MLKLYTTRRHIDRYMMDTDELTMRHTYDTHPGMMNTLFEVTNILRDEFGAVVIDDPTYRPEKSKHTPSIRRLDYSPEGEATLTYIEEVDYYIHDCELLLYDTDTDSAKMISLKEARSGMYEAFVERNNEKDLLITAQFYNWFQRDFDVSQHKFKILTMPYYASYPSTDLNFFYERRKCILGEFKDKIIDKMFGAGTTDRPDFGRLETKGYLGSARGTYSQYLREAIRYKMGLSIGGVAEICHREVDYMAIGLPNIRLEYMSQFNPPLIPDVHYISVSREKNGFPWDARLNRIGGDDYAQAYIDRFLEVKDDEEFLRYVATNAREYYENYCDYGNRAKHLVKLMGMYD